MKHAIVILLLMAGPAWAQPQMRDTERARLDQFETTFGAAMLQALSEGTQNDVAALTRALSGAPQIAFDENLTGDWKCRTIKLGGIAALTVYTNFKCRFSIGSQGFDFEKLSGSQRTRGTIVLRAGRAIYLGVGFVKGATAPSYADLPDDFQSDGTVQTQVAIFERIDPSRARLMFPSPVVESDFDILELTR